MHRQKIIPPLAAAALAISTAQAASGEAEQAAAAAGQADGHKSAEQIRACTRANLPDKTMIQRVTLTPVGRAGDKRHIKIAIFLKRYSSDQSRATLQVQAPLNVSGASYLLIDNAGSDQVFLYLPSLQRVRRVTGNGAASSLLGSDFSYQDMQQIRAMSAGGQVKRLADTKVEGRSAYQLALMPAGDKEGGYRRVVFAIDRKTCVPLRVNFFANGDKPRKRMTADIDSLEQIHGNWLARRLTMRNLHTGTHTTLAVTHVVYDTNVSEAVFGRRTFYLGVYLSHDKTDAAD